MFLLPLNDWKWSWTFPICHGSFEHVSRPFMVTQWGIKWKRGSLHPGIPAVVILGTRHPRPQSWPWHGPNTACSWACGPIETSETCRSQPGNNLPPFESGTSSLGKLCGVLITHTNELGSRGTESSMLHQLHNWLHPTRYTLCGFTGTKHFFHAPRKKSAQNHNLCVTYWTDCMCHTVKFEYKLSSRWPCIKTVYSGRELCPQGMLWHP